MSKLDYRSENFNGKLVYIFEDHATALLPWAEYRRKTTKSPFLLTLDHHTDTREAFTAELSKDDQILRMEVEQWIELSQSEAQKIDYRSESSVSAAVERLRNDEHIDAAIHANILNAAFIICYSEPEGTTSVEEDFYSSTCSDFSENYVPEQNRKPMSLRPHKFDIPYGRRFIIGSSRGFCRADSISVGENLLQQYNLALESSWLMAKLSYADEMIRSFGSKRLIDEDFILDIDLDYFHTEKSLKPDDCRAFYNLIRKAKIITIARESGFVGMKNDEIEAVRISLKSPNADEAIEAVIEHIKEATR